jgi:type VI secretion system protein VasD
MASPTPKTVRLEAAKTPPTAQSASTASRVAEQGVPDVTRKTIQASDEIRKQSYPTVDPSDSHLATRIDVGADANPYFVRSENRERASPIAVRFYQLRSFAAFENATFSSIFEDEQHALGESLLSREEFQLMPGETHKFDRTLSKDTRYIGVLAAFRKLERAQWRAHIAIDSINSTELLVLIHGTTVQLNGH